MEFLTQAVLGKVIQELAINPMIDGVTKKATSTKKMVKRVRSVLEFIGPTVNRIRESRIEQSSGEGDGPKGEGDKLIQLYEEGQKYSHDYTRAHWQWKSEKYARKFADFYESLLTFFQVYMQLEQSKKMDEILARLRQSGNVGYSGQGDSRVSGACYAPKPPAIMVGLDVRIREVKKLLFKEDASLIVVTAPGGGGKTAFVQKLCQDPHVKDMWAELYKLDKNGVQAISNLCELYLQNLLNLVVTRKAAAGDEGWYDDNACVLQHDLLRDLAIHLSSREPMEQRNRLFLDLSGNNLPDWWTEEKQPCIKARLLSISTDEMFCSSWCNMQAPEVEVLVINFQTKEKQYTLPESFMRQMHKLKVLVVTNYGFSIPEMTNFSVLSSLSSLKRIRLERVSIPTHCSTMVELKNLEKITLVMCKINQAFKGCEIQITAEMLPNLKEINIDSCNDLEGLSEWLCDLAQLRKLSITNCHKLSALPEGIGRLKNLEVLRLNACTKLAELQDSIVRLNKLSFLDISGCSQLKKLPQQMGNLCSLRKLNMRRCSRLRELPLSIMDLSQLDIICDPEMARLWEVGNFANTRNEEIIDLQWLHL